MRGKKWLILVISLVIVLLASSVGVTRGSLVDLETSGGNTFTAWTSTKWLQTTQADFEAGVLNNVDTSSSPGDVKLAKESYSIDLQVAAGTDDGYREQHNEDKKLDTTGYNIWGIHYYKGDYIREPFFRFPAVAVPQGATINVAYLRGYSHGIYNNDYVKTRIYGEHANDPLAVTSWDDFGSRAKTTYYTDWTIEHWADDTYYNSPSLVNVVSDIVEEGWWASGEAMQFLCFNNGTTTGLPGIQRFWESYDRDPAHPVSLHVEYTVYVASGTIASQVLDTGVAGARWDALFWDETVEGGTTDITFEVRASDDSFLKDAAEPAWGDYDPASLPSGQYKQWRATLTTSDTSKTPTLHEVRVYHY